MENVKTYDEAGNDISDDSTFVNEIDADGNDSVLYNDKDLRRITNLKLQKIWETVDRDAYWEVVKCTGQMKDDSFSRVSLPFTRIKMLGKNQVDKGDIIEQARNANWYAKDSGIFSVIQTII